MSSVRDRRKALELLAWSKDDPGCWFLDPKGSGRRSTSGLGQAKRITCPTCSVTPAKNVKPKPGYLLDKFGREAPCPMCTKEGAKKGTGKVWADSTDKGDVVVQSADTTAQPTKAPKSKKCEQCDGLGALPNGRRCHWCAGEGRITLPTAFVMADEGGGGEKDPYDSYRKAIEKRDALGDYRALAILETELRTSNPDWLLWFQHVYASPGAKKGKFPEDRLAVLGTNEQVLCERAVRFFLEWMPAEIRVPKAVIHADEKARAQPEAKGCHADPYAQAIRDKAIRERRQNGASIKDLMFEFNLGKSQVYELVAEVEAA